MTTPLFPEQQESNRTQIATYLGTTAVKTTTGFRTYLQFQFHDDEKTYMFDGSSRALGIKKGKTYEVDAIRFTGVSSTSERRIVQSIKIIKENN